MTSWYKYKVIPLTEEELEAKKDIDNKPWRVEVTFNHPAYGVCMLLENKVYKEDSYPLYISYKLMGSGVIQTSKAEDAGLGNIPRKVFKEFGY